MNNIPCESKQKPDQKTNGQTQVVGALLLHTFGRLPSSVKVTAGGVGRCREKGREKAETIREHVLLQTQTQIHPIVYARTVGERGSK